MAVVFGSEANGLGREELALCHQLVRIPTEPAHPSLNLAQAVLVVAYELYTALEPQPAGEPSQRATAGELEAALSQLEQGLLGIGYLNQQNPAPVLAELRRLLARAAPTPREAGLLRGLARQISWAAARIAEGRRADR
jgi:TrmH family RNA methyltransferase